MWIVYAITAAVIWGLDYTVGERILANKISPATLLTLQIGIGTLCFVALGFHFVDFKKELSIIMHSRSLLWLTFWAIVTFNVANLLIFFSIQEKNAAYTGLIELSYPIFIILFSWLIFHQNRMSWSLLVGGSLILIGAGVITYFQ